MSYLVTVRNCNNIIYMYPADLYCTHITRFGRNTTSISLTLFKIEEQHANFHKPTHMYFELINYSGW